MGRFFTAALLTLATVLVNAGSGKDKDEGYGKIGLPANSPTIQGLKEIDQFYEDFFRDERKWAGAMNKKNWNRGLYLERDHQVQYWKLSDDVLEFKDIEKKKEFKNYGPGIREKHYETLRKKLALERHMDNENVMIERNRRMIKQRFGEYKPGQGFKKEGALEKDVKTHQEALDTLKKAKKEGTKVKHLDKRLKQAESKLDASVRKIGGLEAARAFTEQMQADKPHEDVLIKMFVARGMDDTRFIDWLRIWWYELKNWHLLREADTYAVASRERMYRYRIKYVKEMEKAMPPNITTDEDRILKEVSGFGQLSKASAAILLDPAAVKKIRDADDQLDDKSKELQSEMFFGNWHFY